MCTDCNEITIPIGPTGPPGPIGPRGVNGTNGTNGTNAFKFIKEFTSVDDAVELLIEQAELVACGAVPVGCLGTDTLSIPMIDYHIQVWYFDGGRWRPLSNNQHWPGTLLGVLPGDPSYHCNVLSTTLITQVHTTVTLAKIRVVIIG